MLKKIAKKVLQFAFAVAAGIVANYLYDILIALLIL